VLVEKQRELGKRLGAMVTEGRDQGSVAFPHADFKFFMDADVKKRAERRLVELLSDGEDVTLEQVIANLNKRDKTDSSRPVGPLMKPDDAIVIETSELSIPQVIDRLIEELRAGGADIPAGATSAERLSSAEPKSP
jgi:cytidylate kinase